MGAIFQQQQMRNYVNIYRKRCSLLELPVVTPYTIDDHPLALVASSKDLGVLVNNKLTWNLPISSVVANKTLGFLYHHFGSSYICLDHRKLLYLILVCSHLSYASEVLYPLASLCKSGHLTY